MNTAHTEHNVDPAEIQKFEELANRWWDKEGEFKALHDMNPIRLNFINTNTPLAGKKVLDVGCGGGILTESLARADAVTTGIDMGKAPLTTARLHASEEELDVDYQQVTVEAHAVEQAGRYDVVTCMELLEHVPDPASIINACAQLVKPGGSLYFSTINRNAKSYLFAILGAEYMMKLLPKGTHDYSKFIRPSELDIWARQAGLNLANIEGISYNPLTSMFRNSHDVDINYMVHYLRPAN